MPRPGIAVWVRPAAKSYAHVATMLDAGADGIMVPMLETPEEARELVEWARYRPAGKRGCAFGFAQEAYRGMSPLEAQKAANDRITLIGLIETRKGLQNAEAILATPGIDIGWMGHFDMSDDFGIPGKFEDAIMQKAFDDLALAAKNTGKTAATADADMTFLKAQAARGYRCHGYGNDVAVMRMAMSRGISELKSMVGRTREKKLTVDPSLRLPPDYRALVTAGASGIGKAITLALLKAGAKVHVCDVDKVALAALTDEHLNASGTVCDVADEHQVETYSATSVRRLGAWMPWSTMPASPGPPEPSRTSIRQNGGAAWT